MTIDSFRRLLENSGFKIEKKVAFGPPVKDLNPNSKTLSIIDSISSGLAKMWPRLFAFSILIICKRPDSIDDLTEKTFADRLNKKNGNKE